MPDVVRTPPLEKELVPLDFEDVPELIPPSSSSEDEETSTLSTEAQPPDDVATPDSGASGSTPANPTSPEYSDCQGETSQGSQSPQVDPPIPPQDENGSSSDENEGLIQRRRVGDQAPGEVEEQEDEPNAEQVVVIEPPRRSPTSHRFITSLTRGFENSNEYFINFLLKWQAYSIVLSDSKYLLFVQLVLMGVSITSLVIGSIYLQSCPICFRLPGLLQGLGILGTILMVFRMMLVLHKNYSTHQLFMKFLRKAIILLNIIYLAIFAWELTEYFTCINAPPVAGQAGYCNPFLLSCAKVYNFAAITLVFISLILHGPAYLQYSWNIGGPDLPDS